MNSLKADQANVSGNVCTSDATGSCDTTLPCTGTFVPYNGAHYLRTDLQKTMPPAPNGFEYAVLDKNKIADSYKDLGDVVGRPIPSEVIDGIKNTKSSEVTFDSYERGPNNIFGQYYEYGCSNANVNSDECKNIKAVASVWAGKYVHPPPNRQYCAFESDDAPTVLMNNDTGFITYCVPDQGQNNTGTFSGKCCTGLSSSCDTNITCTGTQGLTTHTDLQKPLPPAPNGFQYMTFDKNKAQQVLKDDPKMLDPNVALGLLISQQMDTSKECATPSSQQYCQGDKQRVGGFVRAITTSKQAALPAGVAQTTPPTQTALQAGAAQTTPPTKNASAAPATNSILSSNMSMYLIIGFMALCVLLIMVYFVSRDSAPTYAPMQVPQQVYGGKTKMKLKLKS